MKKLFCTLFSFLFLSSFIYGQGDFPCGVYPVQKNNTIKWYLNEAGLGSVELKRQVGGPNLPIAEVRSVVRSAISNALSNWGTPESVSCVEGSSSDRNLEIQFIGMSPGEYGHSPNNNTIYK
ncbi:MAG: hypothetical protein HXY50_07355 [Ignavibacteriaceae bacterium]|nr:hypothetical protein [Ignavibacteriaceae bacterium]